MSCFRFGPDQTKHLPGTNEKQVSTITFQTGAKSCYKLLCELKKYHLEEQSADVVLTCLQENFTRSLLFVLQHQLGP